MESEEIKTARAFHDAINRHDVDALCALMDEQHRFIDSSGTVTQGVEAMKAGWAGYFRMFPDYHHELSTCLQTENTVVMLGQVSATYNGKRGLVAENRIRMPAAWRAVVANRRVTEWQVYADWSEGRKVIAEDDKTGK